MKNYAQSFSLDIPSLQQRAREALGATHSLRRARRRWRNRGIYCRLVDSIARKCLAAPLLCPPTAYIHTNEAPC